MTAHQWEETTGIILLILAVIGVIVILSLWDSHSRREQGLPSKKGKKSSGGNHEKKP